MWPVFFAANDPPEEKTKNHDPDDDVDKVVDEGVDAESKTEDGKTEDAANQEKAKDRSRDENSFLSFFSSAGKGIVDGGLNGNI